MQPNPGEYLLQRYRETKKQTSLPDTYASTPLDGGAAAEVEKAHAEGRQYNPRYEYQADSHVPDTSRLEDLLKETELLSRAHDDWTLPHFAAFLERQIKWTHAVHRHSAERMSSLCAEEYGVVTEEDVRDARTLLELHPEPAPEEVFAANLLDPSEVARIMAALLELIGARHWEVSIESMVARMAVNSGRRKLKLNASALYPEREVLRLAVHEVGCHVLRSATGEEQARPLLGLGIGRGHLCTEEGLAVWLESATGVLQEKDQRKYALRVIATHAAQHGSFSDTYSAVRSYTGPSEAYAIVKRCKRGLIDTEEPGGYLKDHLYLIGWNTVAARVQQDPSVKAALYAGKTSLSMTEETKADLELGALHHGPDLESLGRALAEEARQQLAMARPE